MIKILCVPQRGIGDFIHALPLIHSLRNAFKDSEIIIPVVDKRQISDYSSLEKICQGIVSFLYQTIREDLESRRVFLYRAKNFPDMYKIEADERIKFEKELYEYYLRGKIFDITIILRDFYIDSLITDKQFSLKNIQKIHNQHIVERNLEFTKLLGIPKIIDFKLNININEVPKNIIGKPINSPPNSIILVLGAGRSDKKWTIKGYRDIALFCESNNYTPILVGSAEDYERSKNIETNKTINLINLNYSMIDLDNFCKLAYKSKVVIGPDTGLIHLADAMGVKVIGLYGPTRPYKFAPYRNKEHIVSTNHTSKLMSDINSKDVISKLEKILE